MQIPSLYMGYPSSIMLIFVFIFLISDVVAIPLVTIESVH
jgi:hypothetical protein